jgi:hypothetical protein
MKTFMHYRKHDRMGQIKPCGGLTLAIHNEKGSNTVTVALVECAKTENFNRKRGREIAEARLDMFMAGTEREKLSKRVHVVTLPEATNLKSFIHEQKFVKEKTNKLLAGSR